MKNDEILSSNKPYDAVEDAIDLSRKDTNSTWDDLSKKKPSQARDGASKETQTDKVTACERSR
ncbi:MAG TPA: hypothetical protein VOA41_11405 [Candidatus Dormibacteraeota bacterium]|nr:hypothetical protein [Candidatus Dormibacteraeota bacterium]